MRDTLCGNVSVGGSSRCDKWSDHAGPCSFKPLNPETAAASPVEPRTMNESESRSPVSPPAGTPPIWPGHGGKYEHAAPSVQQPTATSFDGKTPLLDLDSATGGDKGFGVQQTTETTPTKGPQGLVLRQCDTLDRLLATLVSNEQMQRGLEVGTELDRQIDAAVNAVTRLREAAVQLPIFWAGASPSDPLETPAGKFPLTMDYDRELIAGQIIRAAVDHDSEKMRFYLTCSVGEVAQRIVVALARFNSTKE